MSRIDEMWEYLRVDCHLDVRVNLGVDVWVEYRDPGDLFYGQGDPWLKGPDPWTSLPGDFDSVEAALGALVVDRGGVCTEV